jgi:hypothetical protein
MTTPQGMTTMTRTRVGGDKLPPPVDLSPPYLGPAFGAGGPTAQTSSPAPPLPGLAPLSWSAPAKLVMVDVPWT